MIGVARRAEGSGAARARRAEGGRGRRPRPAAQGAGAAVRDEVGAVASLRRSTSWPRCRRRGRARSCGARCARSPTARRAVVPRTIEDATVLDALRSTPAATRSGLTRVSARRGGAAGRRSAGSRGRPCPRGQQVGHPPVGDHASVAGFARPAEHRLTDRAARAGAASLGQDGREAQESCVVGSREARVRTRLGQCAADGAAHHRPSRSATKISNSALSIDSSASAQRLLARETHSTGEHRGTSLVVEQCRGRARPASVRRQWPARRTVGFTNSVSGSRTPWTCCSPNASRKNASTSAVSWLGTSA